MAPSREVQLAAKPPKVSAPRAHDGVVWTKLQSGLEKCANLRCIWLYAGPGAGKTQGVRRWLSVRNEPFAWFQVDANDHDPIRVMYYLQHAVSALPLNPQLLTPFNPSLHTDIRVFAEHWFRQIDAILQRPAYLVLDDLHLLGSSVAEHPVLSSLFAARFERLCVVIISRSSPEGQRVVQNGSFATLGPEHCALEPDQIQELLLQRGVDKAKMSPARLAQIAQSSGGWVAAIRLLKALPTGDAMSDELEYDELLYRLIKSELVAPLPVVQQETLRHLSYFNSFSAQIVDALDPSGETRQTVLRYCHENQFVDVLEHADPPSFRFHPLFLDSLQRIESEASPRGPSAERASLLIKLGLAERRFRDALELMIRVQDWDGFVQWISFAGLMLLERAERDTLRVLLDRVPQRVWQAQETPRLRLLHGGSLTYVEPERAMTLLEGALQECLEKEIDGVDLALTICLGFEAILAAGESSSRLMPFWRALEARTEQGFGPGVPASLSFRVAMVANLLIIVCEPRNRYSDAWAREAQTQADKVKLKGEHASSILMNMAQLMAMWASHGYPEKAKGLLPTFQRMAQEGQGAVVELSRIMVEFTFALVQGRFPRAFELYDEGAERSRGVGASNWTFAMSGMTGALAASVGSKERIERLLASATDHEGTQPGIGRINRAMLAGTSEALRGNTPESIREFKLAKDIVDRSGHRIMGITCRCALAAVYARLGNFEEATRHCDEALAISKDYGVRVGDWAIWATQSYLALKKGEDAVCHQSLSQLLQSIKKVGYYTFPTSWTGHYSELLVEALDAGIETTFVQEIIKRNERYDRQDRHPKWPAKYELNCMGTGELYVDGERYADGFVPGQGLYELVLTIMWLGGRDVADHRVMELMWPGKSTNLKNPLHQSLKRLRQNFKRTSAIIYDSGRLSLHPGMWKVDLWELDRKLERIVEQSLEPGALEPQKREELQKALLEAQNLCSRGFANPQMMPQSLLGLARAQQGRPVPDFLSRSLSAAQDALKRV